MEDLLLAAEKGRLNDVQSLLDGGRCKVDDEDEVSPCTSSVGLCVVSVCLQNLGVCVFGHVSACMCFIFSQWDA